MGEEEVERGRWECYKNEKQQKKRKGKKWEEIEGRGEQEKTKYKNDEIKRVTK